ncbi:MAG: Fic family protein [Bdellovibrionaceae bacterium]|nr:Fic family protein [Bdellovibrio sp.]
MYNPNVPFNLKELPPPFTLQSHPNFMEILRIHNEALQAISQLEGALNDLERPSLFLSTFYLNESISSNAVENIHTTIVSALADQTKPADERTNENKEVLNYRQALLEGTKSLKNYGLSSRTIKAIHQKLKINKGSPGEFRRIQNQIGNRKKNGTVEVIYTPPEANNVDLLISNWEKFILENDSFFPLIKAAICHYQFEAIHPFEDGNGRCGRILMIIQLLQDNLLRYPALFISEYLSEHEDVYKKMLLRVTTHSEWWGFIEFMLTGFVIQAKKTHIGILQLKHAKKEVKTLLFTLGENPIRKSNVTAVLDHIFHNPVTHAKFMEKELGIHWQTCAKYLRELSKL